MHSSEQPVGAAQIAAPKECRLTEYVALRRPVRFGHSIALVRGRLARVAGVGRLRFDGWRPRYVTGV